MASTQGVRDSVRLDLQLSYSGSVRVASNINGPARRAIVQLYEAGSSDPIETTIFIKQSPRRTGELVVETDDKTVWFYSVQAKGAYIKVSIQEDHSGKFEYLNTMKPITVRQAPTESSKAQKNFYLSAILAEDVSDKESEHYNFDDGIVTVLQDK